VALTWPGTLVLFTLFAVVMAQTPTASGQQPDVAGVRNLPAGWNLVALPPGTSFSVQPSAILTFEPSGAGFQALASTDGAVEGKGYWVNVPAASLMSMPSPLHDGVEASFPAPPDTWIMIGDTTSFYPGFVSGADEVFTYDEENGYRNQSILFPGQGAWAISHSGGTITISPGSPSGLPPMR
jgi:hypothetical protein